jgi:quinol monooxygenase YgiN
MIIVTGQARLGAGEVERLRGALNAWIRVARGRDGCLSYCYGVDIGEPDLIHVIEMWRDEAAIDAHMENMGPLMDVLAGVQMLSLSVKGYEGKYLKTLMGGE